MQLFYHYTPQRPQGMWAERNLTVSGVCEALSWVLHENDLNGNIFFFRPWNDSPIFQISIFMGG